MMCKQFKSRIYLTILYGMSVNTRFSLYLISSTYVYNYIKVKGYMGFLYVHKNYIHEILMIMLS